MYFYFLLFLCKEPYNKHPLGGTLSNVGTYYSAESVEASAGEVSCSRALHIDPVMD